MNKITVVAFLALTAGTAVAGNISPGSPNYPVRTVLAGSNTQATGYGQRADFSLDVSGRQSWDSFGDADNQVIMVDVAAALGLASGTGVTVTGISWDVDIETTLAGPFGGSWLSEARFTYGNTTNFNLVGLRPGAGVNSGGHQRFTSPFVNFVDVGIPDIVCADGLLRIELNETFDDSNGEVDANYLAQSFLGIRAIPAPGALALLGLGGLIAGRRRR